MVFFDPPALVRANQFASDTFPIAATRTPKKFLDILDVRKGHSHPSGSPPPYDEVHEAFLTTLVKGAVLVSNQLYRP